MNLISHIRTLSYRYGYLLIFAAWLYTFSFLFQYYWSYTSSPQQVKKTLEKSIQRRTEDFHRFISNMAELRALAEGTAPDEVVKHAAEKDYFIFLAGEGDEGYVLQFWNTQVIAPTADQWQLPEGTSFQKLVNGDYVQVLKRIHTSGGHSLMAMALIPIHWRYFVTTDYLQNRFAYHLSLNKYYEISPLLTGPAVVRDAKGVSLFSVMPKQNVIEELGWLPILLRLAAVVLILIFVHRLSTGLATKYDFRWAFFVLTVLLLLLRIISYLLPFPLELRQFQLFDPTVYGTNFILKSLGDLLLNVLLVLWLLLFFLRYKPKVYYPAFALPQPLQRWGWGAVLILISFMTGGIVRSLVADGNIPFNVTQFFSLNFFSLIGFVTLGLLMINYYLLLNIIFPIYSQVCNKNIVVSLLHLAVLGLIYITITFSAGASVFKLAVLLWLLLTIVLLHADVRWNVLLPMGGSVLMWILYFSVALTFLLMYENKLKEVNDRRRMAEKLGMQNDPSTENLLSIALASFRSDFLRDEFKRFTIPSSAQVLRDSLLNENFSGYLNKFDTRIYVFNEKEEGLFNPDSVSYNTLNTIYSLQSKNTTVKDWRYYEASFDKFYYIAKRVVSDTGYGSLKGYVFIISKPRLYAEGKFLPELFARSNYTLPEGDASYAFAIYQRGELVAHYNDYPFPAHLPADKKLLPGFTEEKMEGLPVLWYNAGGGRIVVIVNKQNDLLEAITLFAYLFCVFLLMLASYRVIQLILHNGVHIERWKKSFQWSLRAEVHSIIILISVISFLVIGISTIVFFINRHYRTNKERLSRTIQIMRTEVEEVLKKHAVFDDVIRIYDDIASDALQESIIRIGEIHSVEINVYDPRGTLRISSQPFYYNKGLLSRQMEPFAYHLLAHKHLIQIITNEKIGSRQYTSIYVPVREDDGKTYAFLNIPYFTSETELKQEISNFLVTLINLYAFIFVIAGLLAFIITSRITGSFSMIADKMKEIQLGKPNEAIVWKRNDEIGALVAEYNKMVQQLEASAAKLAKSEREGAWREMARQVAHEIKNSLTPMKLSIQYLQKALDANAPSAKDIAENVYKTLVEQIDYLSTIASEFSNFANIGNPKMEEVDLVQSLQSVVDLFKMEAKGEINFRHPSLPVPMMADKTHLNRLFTNLLRNALDAIPADRTPKIEVSLTLIDGQAKVAVTDNGTGIKQELRDRIFYPNFTTKSSGTGLGLAMCKGIVEQMKGNIWFETETEKGTTFFVQVPVNLS